MVQGPLQGDPCAIKSCSIYHSRTGDVFSLLVVRKGEVCSSNRRLSFFSDKKSFMCRKLSEDKINIQRGW